MREQNPTSGIAIRDLDRRALAIPLEDGAKLNIAAYSVLELDEERITITVNGFLEQSPTRRFSFAQNFILEEKEGRMFVVRDSLHLCDDRLTSQR
jgi:hypothetical protein